MYLFLARRNGHTDYKYPLEFCVDHIIHMRDLQVFDVPVTL